MRCNIRIECKFRSISGVEDINIAGFKYHHRKIIIKNIEKKLYWFANKFEWTHSDFDSILKVNRTRQAVEIHRISIVIEPGRTKTSVMLSISVKVCHSLQTIESTASEQITARLQWPIHLKNKNKYYYIVPHVCIVGIHIPTED